MRTVSSTYIKCNIRISIYPVLLMVLLIAVPTILIQCKTDKRTEQNSKLNQVNILSFNILQGGHDASNVGFPNSKFNGSRFDDLVNVILETNADIVGVQED